MTNDPFAPLTSRQRRKRSLRRILAGLGRPLRPTRISTSREGPANLIMVGIDTLRADHLGAWGYRRPTSPFLDRLGSQGTLFSDVSACSPWTLPSFASALTGITPGLHGAYLPGGIRNMDTQPPQRLLESHATLATHLRAQGYRTAAFYSNQFFAFGLAESFDHHCYLNDEADEVIRVAMDWIRSHGDRPFFCFILVNDPHEPTTPGSADLEPFLVSATAQGTVPTPSLLRGLARWGEKPAPALGTASEPLAREFSASLAIKIAIYDATIHQVDRAIGKMNDQLTRWGLSETTLQTVFSDHGEEFLDHVEWARRWDHDPRSIRAIGHGHTLFQELLHVPWLAWGPGVPAGVTRKEPVSLLDLSPTVLDWLDLPPLPAPGGVPSELAPMLTGRSLAEPRSESLAPHIILSEAIAYGPDLISIRCDRWKLIARRDGHPLALFDLETDPRERTDVSSQQPKILAELQDIAKRWCDSGLGATGTGDGGSWQDMDAEIHQRLKDLGYSQ